MKNLHVQEVNLRRPLYWFAQKTRDKFAQNAIWIFVGQIFCHLLRACYFLIIARLLGAEQYGVFIGVVALVAVTAPFSSLGSVSLLIKNVSRDKSVFREYWGNALLMNTVSGCVLVTIVYIVARLILPAHVSALLILAVAIADLVFNRMLDNSAAAFQAFDMLHITARLYVCQGLFKLLGAVALVVLVHRPSATSWAISYLLAAAASAWAGVALTSRRLGAPVLATHFIRREAAEGLYFSGGQASETIYNDIDKTMLTALAALHGAGIYAAAYRIIDVAFVPINSLLWASYSRFFIKGNAGINSSSAYAKQLLSRASVYSVVASLGLFVCAPLAPRVLGAQYLQTVEALRWLAPIPVLRMIHRFLGFSLAGAGFQGARTLAQFGVAIVNVLLNLWLIPLYSWRGAGWSSLASDGLLVVTLSLITFSLRRQQSRTIAQAEVVPAAQ